MTLLCAVVMTFGMWLGMDDQAADRDLIAKAAQSLKARQSQQVDQAAPQQAEPAKAADDLAETEARARNELLFAQARLDLVQARRLLQENSYAAAAAKARRALQSLTQLATTMDVSVYELQAEGIIARAERNAPPTMGQIQGEVEIEVADPNGEIVVEVDGEYPPDELDRKARAAAKVGRRYTGGPVPEIDTSGDADALRERALMNQEPHDDYGYRPGEELVDVRAILDRDEQRHFYERALRLAYKSIEARLLMEADEARVVPEGEIAYPNDWPERVARRQQYADGVIARSDSWTDADGREWYLAVYDIHDLIYVPPDFTPTDGIPLSRSIRELQDRAALRDGSYIFTGYPEDLAVGIPLLRYFGGVDDYAIRGPKYSLERQAQIVNLINRFLAERTAEPAVGP